MTANPKIDEPVHLTAFDPLWTVSAAEQVAVLRHQLRGFDLEIEHIGSTAVEGMSAKPILDLMVGLRGADDLELIAGIASLAGWTDLGEAGVPGRRHLRRRDSLALNLHLVAQNSSHWRQALALRDYLRTHASERDAYGDAKRHAIAAGHRCLLGYSDAKGGYVSALIERALWWARPGPGKADGK